MQFPGHPAGQDNCTGSSENRRPTVIATILIAGGAILVAVIGSALVAPPRS
jgi:hypothetical protein